MRFFVLCLLLAAAIPAGVAPAYSFEGEDAAFAEVSAFDAEWERDYREFLGEQTADFQEFLDERDRDFAEFLQEQWREFASFEGLLRDDTPKPKVIPVAPVAPKPEPPVVEPPVAPKPEPPVVEPPVVEPPVVEPPIVEPPVVEPPVVEPPVVEPPVVEPPLVEPPVVEPPAVEPPAVEPPVVEPPSLPDTSKKTALFSFYGRQLRIAYDPALAGSVGERIDNGVIGGFWRRAGGADFAPLLERLSRLRSELKLNDWGFYRLSAAFAEEVSPSRNDETLLTWFLLTKSGYRARVGFDGDRVYLLVPSGNTVYQLPYYSLKGVKYYNFSALGDGDRPGSIRTYDEEYPGAERELDFDLRHTPLTGPALADRDLAFSYGGKDYSLKASFNRNTLAFYDDYPSTDMDVFFSAIVSPEAEKSLIEGLRPVVAGKSETEAANILLRFVQTAFEYQTDGDQFGREKYMFATETLFFPYSDCEDRAILFGYLVKKLLGLEVVGLLYPGHAATAVRFSSEPGGDSVLVDGRSYLVCDPTYINADIGMAMPQYRQVEARIIPIGDR